MHMVLINTLVVIQLNRYIKTQELEEIIRRQFALHSK